MTDAGAWSEATSMNFPHFGTPDKRTAGPQYTSTPVRSGCTQDDEAASESDISTFLATLDEFVEHCDSFLIPHQSADTAVVHAQVTAPGRRAGAEVNPQEHACSIQRDCFVEGNIVDCGERVDESNNGIVFTDKSEYIETCCSEPCASYSQNAPSCPGRVLCNEHDCADHLNGYNCCQELECKQDCDTCEGASQEPSPISRNLGQRNFQNYSDGTGKKHAHLPLSFCQEDALGCTAHGKKEGEQYEQHPDHYDKSFASQECFMSGENEENAKNVSCTCSELTLVQNFNHQEHESRSKPHVASPQSIHVANDKLIFKEWEEASKEGNNKHYLLRFTSHCQSKDSCTPKNYLQRPYKNFGLCPNNHNSNCAAEKTFTSSKNNKSAIQMPCTSFAGSVKHKKTEETRSELYTSSYNSSCVMEDASTFKQHEEPLEPEHVTRSEVTFKNSCTMEDVFAFNEHEPIVPEHVARSEPYVSSFNSCHGIEGAFTLKKHQRESEHRLKGGSFSSGSLRDDHISERCSKQLHVKGLNQCPKQEKLALNSLPSNAHESKFDAHLQSSILSVCSSHNQMYSSGPHPHGFTCSCYAADKRSGLCAAAHGKVTSCDSNNSFGKSILEGCASSLLSPEKKDGESGVFAENGKDDVIQSRICIAVPESISNEGKTKQSSIQLWLQEANVGSPTYFTGIEQATPDDCTRRLTCHKDVQTAPVSRNTGDESGSALSTVANDHAYPLHNGEPGDSNDVLHCNSVYDENRLALTLSEEKFESEIASHEDEGFKGTIENNATNAGVFITKSNSAPASDICEVIDDGADSHDTTLVAANDRNTASSMSKHDLLSPSRSVMSEDILDVIYIDEDDEFVAEVESPAASTKGTKEHQKQHVRNKESKSESPVPVCTVSPKDLHTQNPPDILMQPHSYGNATLVPPFSEEAPNKLKQAAKQPRKEQAKLKHEDMRKKIDSIRQQREQQSDFHAQASCSRTVDDQVVEHQGPCCEASGAKHRAAYMSENPEENMDNENPGWEAVRRLTTEEERYQAVKKVWHHSRIPDPHHQLTSFHYHRRHLLGLESSKTPARKRGKRKASRDSSSEYAKPAKRQRFDTDVIDLKLKELRRKKDKDVSKAHDMLRYDMDMLHRDLVGNEAHSSGYRGRPQHRRAHTTPWDFRYYQMEERRIHEEFMASAQSINIAYSARENKLLSVREEVRHFDAFYAGLQGSDPRLLSERQIKENLKSEKLLGHFNVVYGAAKN